MLARPSPHPPRTLSIGIEGTEIVAEYDNMPDTSSRLQYKITPLKIIFILVANTLIDLFIVVVQPGSSFNVSFIYSQCIGISIGSFVITTSKLIKKGAPDFTASRAGGRGDPCCGPFLTFRKRYHKIQRYT